MEIITQKEVIETIQNFFNERMNLDKEYKTLEKLKEGDDSEKIETQLDKISKIKEKYDFKSWFADNALRFSEQLKFGTHLSKGIHPDSRGDNINFNAVEKVFLNKSYLGSQALRALQIDAGGNAAALPLFGLLESEVKGGASLFTLLQENHPALKGAFADDATLSDHYQNAFQSALNNVFKAPSTSERNKQILWAIDGFHSNGGDNYQNIIPLYPISLACILYQKVQARFSDENRERQKNRSKKTAIKKSYFTFVDLAVTKLGGAQPQNVSQLNSRQGGRHYLLPSLPPQLSERRGFYPRKGESTLFTDRLANYPLCRQGLEQMAAVIHNDRNNKRVRNQRDYGFDLIIAGLITIAKHLQKEPNWSDTYALNKNERLWLDKGYNPATRDASKETIHQDNLSEKTQEIGQKVGQNMGHEMGQEISPAPLIEDSWLREIERSFALWLNQQLKKRAGRKELFLDDTEVRNWRLNFREIVLQYNRRGEGVFYHV